MNSSHPIEHERREQLRADIREARGIQEAPHPVAPGRVLLATLHRSTEVRIADIVSVTRLQKPSLGLHAVVELLGGTRHFVPDAEPVLRAIREHRPSNRRHQREEYAC